MKYSHSIGRVLAEHSTVLAHQNIIIEQLLLSVTEGLEVLWTDLDQIRDRIFLSSDIFSSNVNWNNIFHNKCNLREEGLWVRQCVLYLYQIEKEIWSEIWCNSELSAAILNYAS